MPSDSPARTPIRPAPSGLLPASRLRYSLLLPLLVIAACADGSGGLSTGADLSAVDGCASDSDCKAGLRCDVASRTCVACLDDTHCPAGEICAPHHACARGCSEGKPCGDAGVCSPGRLCVECTTDADCGGDRPRCDVPANRCVACLAADDDCPVGRYCAVMGGQTSCAPGCNDDPDCASVDGGVPAFCDVPTHRCITCRDDAACPDGAICREGACVPGCSDARPCGMGLVCCEAQCVDVGATTAHCGACGNACPGGFICCNSACVNPIDSIMNCGMCGVTCKAANGSPSCVNRTCGIASCAPGYEDCNGIYKDGCETRIEVNIIHCGACNNACSIPRAQPRCAGGACLIDTCIFPWGDCNNNLDDGCETETRGGDLKNCGGCGVACEVPNGAPSCQGGICGVAACNPGFADCNRDDKDGCEAQLAVDLRNCGVCGAMCSPARATPDCRAGVCSIAACDAGFADCNRDVKDGCEIDTTSDAAHCGACGNACPSGNGVAACQMGLCRITCDAHFGNCDQLPANGCESDLRVTLAHCGACGNACPPVAGGAPGCDGGVCGIASCDMGRADCNAVAKDGCEVELGSDLGHCGACGNACPPVANGSSACVAGACGIGMCDVRRADCNVDPKDGCEIDLSSSNSNCGACGNACAAWDRCVAGVCSRRVYGSGSDGALVVPNGQTAQVGQVRTGASGAAGALLLGVVSSMGFAAGQTVIVHQSQGVEAGKWEVNNVAGAVNNVLTLGRPLVHTYVNGGGDRAQVMVVPQFTTVDIQAGGALVAPAWDGNTGGILALQVAGKATISGSIDMNARGFRGPSRGCPSRCSPGKAGESEVGVGAASRSPNGSGGGGGEQGQDCAMGGGGSYGAVGGAGPNGSRGSCATAQHLGGLGGALSGAPGLEASLLFGGAGGEGGADEDGGNPGGGGNGGGAIAIWAATIELNGAITSAGGNGAGGNQFGCGGVGGGMGGGGGGAGGGVLLVADSAMLGVDRVTARGGTGGGCSPGNTPFGGSGGVGRIAVRAPDLEGSTNPALFRY